MTFRTRIVIALTALALLAAGAALAETTGQCGDNVTWSLTESGVVTITGTGPMWNYNWTTNPSPFESAGNVKSAVIGSGVTSVGAWLFDECENLTSVSIAGTVTGIGQGAFYGTGISSVSLPSSLKTIGTSAFRNCANLSGLWFNYSRPTSIGSYAFYGCAKLTGAQIPFSVTSIGENAFKNCASLSSAVIRNRDTAIGTDAFKGCAEGLTLSGFTGSTAAAYQNADGTRPAFSLPRLGSAVTCDMDASGAVTISGTGAMWSLSLESNPSPFAYNTDVRTAVIGSGVTTVGNYLFYGCSGLTGVTLPSGLTAIGSMAFINCGALSGVTLPASLGSIGYSAFQNCDSLRAVAIPAGVTMIDGFAFYDCDGLTQITLPKSVASLGSSVFNGCGSLTEATVLNRAASFGSAVFGNCASSFTLRGYDGSTAMEYAASCGLAGANPKCGDGLTFNIDPAGNAVIRGTGAMWNYTWGGAKPSPFYEDGTVTSVTAEDGVTGIGAWAFANCVGITAAEMADSVASVGAAPSATAGA